MMHSQVPTAAPAVRKPDLVPPRPQMTAPIYHQIADFLLSLLPSGRPRRLARMSKPGETKHEILRDEKTKKPIRNEHGKVIKTGRMIPRDKYEDIYANQLTVAMLRSHARGVNTYSYTIDKNGSARFGVSDVDEGGRRALLALLRAADTLGISAFAIENTKGGKHKGGHLICLFNGEYPAADIEALLHTIHQAAGIPATELWPGCNQGIRGLFGVHQLDQTRGVLLLQSGEIINLDTDLAAGFAAVRDLRLNDTPPATPEAPQSAPKSRTSAATPVAAQRTSAAHNYSGKHDTRGIFTEAIKQWNAAHPHYISQNLAQAKDGNHFCKCGNHSSGFAKIAISFDGSIEYGRSWSPDCIWFPSGNKEQYLDPFAFHVIIDYGGNDRAAKEAAAREYGLWIELKKAGRPLPEEPPEIADRAKRQAYNAKRRDDRRAETLVALDGIYDRVCNASFTSAVPEGVSAEKHSDRAHALFAYLFVLAQEAGRLQVAPTNEKASADLEMCQRYIVYAFRELEAAGLGKRQGGKGGMSNQPNEAATWTFYREPSTPITPVQPEISDAPYLGCKPDCDAECTLSYIASNTQVESKDLVRGGHQPTQATADPPRATQPDMPLTAPEVATAGLEAPSGPQAEYRPEWSLLSNDKAYSLEPEYQTTKDYAPLWWFESWANAAIKVRSDVTGDVADVAEQTLLDSVPPPARKPTRRRSEISALDRYRVDVAMMQPAQLAGEVKKHLATLKKHAGAVWLDQVRQKLAIVEAALAENRPQSKATVPVSPPLTSYYAWIVPSTPQDDLV